MHTHTAKSTVRSVRSRVRLAAWQFGSAAIDYAQKIMMGALVVLTVTGWIAVFFVNQSGSDTEAALAAVKTDLAKKSDELTAAEKKLSTTAEAGPGSP